MELGDHFSDRAERAPLQVALKTLDDAIDATLSLSPAGRQSFVD
jgi:hypothetical protein